MNPSTSILGEQLERHATRQNHKHDGELLAFPRSRLTGNGPRSPANRKGRLAGWDLPRFVSIEGSPGTDMEKTVALHSPLIHRVEHFCLGPHGTNIELAARRWSRRLRLDWKSGFTLTSTPEESLALAREVNKEGILGIFWTCAVFVREHKIFFENPDVLPFFFMEEMPLDAMNLAVRRSNIPSNSGAPSTTWRIATHPSPKPLVKKIAAQVVLADSNAAAAQLCRRGEVEACVTTRSAAELEGLKIIHTFGSPVMIFFGGITVAGAGLLTRAHRCGGNGSI